MIIRKIRPQEYKRVQEINAHAFHRTFKDRESDAEDIIGKLISDPHDRKDLNWAQRWGVFSDDDKTMLSALIAIPDHVNFDGKTTAMLGIADVATLPACRGKGYTDACMKKVLLEQYENGAPISYLFPFSSRFYRKLGYGPACEVNSYSISLDVIPSFEIQGSFHLLERGADHQSEIEQVYNVWYRRYNLMTKDEDIDYRWVREASPFADNEYSYLYRTAEGVPEAYFTYYLKCDNQMNELCCKRFFFGGPEGLQAILYFLKKEGARFHNATFNLPIDVDPVGILTEWRFGKIKCTREETGMVRVINAEKILNSAKMIGSGSLKINIKDPIIDRNNACFEVTFRNGRTVSVTRCCKKADISLDIGDFSSLISGRYLSEMVRFLPGVEVFCDIEKIRKVFYRKPMCITRKF